MHDSMTLEKAAQLPMKESTGPASTSEQPVVLLVEDDTEMRRFVSQALHAAGFRVVEYSTGQRIRSDIDAAFFYDHIAWVPDLVVSDIRLPGSSGMDILKRIRQAKLDVPVIMMTGFGSKAVVSQAERFGALRVFNKPFDIKDLVELATEVAFAKR